MSHLKAQQQSQQDLEIDNEMLKQICQSNSLEYFEQGSTNGCSNLFHQSSGEENDQFDDDSFGLQVRRKFDDELENKPSRKREEFPNFLNQLVQNEEQDHMMDSSYYENHNLFSENNSSINEEFNFEQQITSIQFSQQVKEVIQQNDQQGFIISEYGQHKQDELQSQQPSENSEYKFEQDIQQQQEQKVKKQQKQPQKPRRKRAIKSKTTIELKEQSLDKELQDTQLSSEIVEEEEEVDQQDKYCTKTKNQLGENSCEETKNLFVLAGPFFKYHIQQRFQEHLKKLPLLRVDDNKAKSLCYINKLLKQVEEQQDQGLLIQFRQVINQILDYDFIKYSQNQKKSKSQYVFQKYIFAIRVIFNNKSFTFNSIKAVNNFIKVFLDN